MVINEYSPPLNPIQLFKDSKPYAFDSDSEAKSRRNAHRYAIGSILFGGLLGIESFLTIAGEVAGNAEWTDSITTALITAASGITMVLLGRNELREAGPPDIEFLQDSR